MTEFRFAHGWVLLLLLIPPLVVVFRVYRARQSSATSRTIPVVPALRYSDVRLVQGLPQTWRLRLRFIPDALRFAAWALLVVGLARPQSGQAREVLRGQGIDIVLALDISSSMAALDFEPDNRLTAAKAVISDFVAGREFDRIGLVVFAREAFHQSPMTLDYDVLLRLLDNVRLINQIVDSEGNPLLLDGTAIGLGMVSAATMMRDSPSPSKVIVLLTDGDNNAALDPITSANVVGTLGMRVYTIGMGKTGQIPVLDENGNIVFIESDLNEDTLREIADITNGRYFRAEDLTELRAIYDQIDALERSPVERRIYVPWQDQAWGWLGTGLILLVSERVLRRTLFQEVP